MQTTEDLKSGLATLHARFGELIAAAGRLQNKNFADIAKSAQGRIHQLINHPDVDLVSGHMDAIHTEQQPEPAYIFEPASPKPGFDPKAGA